MKPIIIDLFCGIGGLSLGATRSGFDLALAVDIDETLLGIHQRNFPGYKHAVKDVSKLSGEALVATAGLGSTRVWGLVGGSPCQGFSRIGKRDLADPRNALFIHFFRLVSETSPTFFLLENVPGILDEQNRKIIKHGLSLIQPRYQLLDPFVVKASEFGAATTRERVFFFGYLAGKMPSFSIDTLQKRKWGKPTSIGSALAGLPLQLNALKGHRSGFEYLTEKPTGRFWTAMFREKPRGVGDADLVEKLESEDLVSGCISTKHSRDVIARFSRVCQGKVDTVSRMPRLAADGLCPTLRAGTGPDKGSFQSLRPIHYSEPRVITPREAARLQGFPDWYYLSETKWHAFRGIGNSVSPFVSQALFSVILKWLT